MTTCRLKPHLEAKIVSFLLRASVGLTILTMRRPGVAHLVGHPPQRSPPPRPARRRCGRTGPPGQPPPQGIKI